MERSILVLILAVLGLTSGCAMQPDARYVYQDGQFGVIGIPQNSKFGRKNYQAQARELMSLHFPDGYEIVRSEEVVEGERSLDLGSKTEFATEPSVNALDQMIKFGRLAQTRSIEQKDSIPILESRIIYKRKTAEGPQGANGFAAVESAMPKFYIDPNDMTRCKATKLLADAKDAKKPATSDQSLVKASGDATSPKPADSQLAKACDCSHCQAKTP